MPRTPLPDTAQPGNHRSADATEPQTGCRLCGLPLGGSTAELRIEGEVHRFCCHGCQQVFQILATNPDGPPADFKATDLYRICLDSGLVPTSVADISEGRVPGAGSSPPGSPLADHETQWVQEFSFRVEGMWCSACSWLIEQVLRKTDGVVEARVFFLSDLVVVKYLPHRLNPQQLLPRVAQLGYHAALLQDRSESSAEKRDLLLRLGISAILTVNIMMISFALYYGFLQRLDRAAIGYFSYPLWILATAVIFYGGGPILKRAWLGLRYAGTSMDTLIAVGVLSAYFYSVVQIRSGSLHLYFDTACMLVTVVLVGKFIEYQAREKVSSGITELYRLAYQKVRLLQDGHERWVSAGVVEVGNELIVKTEERIPVDGCVIAGEAGLDESVLTGEARPVRKRVGDDVPGGALVLDGELQLRATRVGAESSLGQVITLMQDALARKNPMEVLADRITRWLVPGILLLAGTTAVFLWRHGAPAEVALLRAVTVLVITCPCALGIATPLAKVAAIGAGRGLGVLIRDPAALERAKDLDLMILDKTGTVTEGSFSLRQVVVHGTSEKEALRLVGSVEAHSGHYLAKEVVQCMAQAGIAPWPVRNWHCLDGLGVEGEVGENAVFVGNRQLMRVRQAVIPAALDERARALEAEGFTVAFFGWDAAWRGFLVFGDRLKATARTAIAGLQHRKLEIRLVSGDSQTTTRAIAEQLRIEHFVGETLPADKVAIVKACQDKGQRVGMVGDGINDAAALAQADVGMAMGARANVVQEASDVTLLTADPAKILTALRLSERTSKIIRQNLFFAFLYNVLAVPLAVTGWLNPVIAVAAMFASSLTVIGNTLRIAKTDLLIESSRSCKQRFSDRS